jgi:hypothetical protein
LPYGKPARWRDVARQRDIPLLVVAYRLLARASQDLDQPVRVAAWEHPWIRTLAPTSTHRARHVRLPAAAVITQHKADGELARRLLLLPDAGTIPVAGYRPVLEGLSQLAQASEDDALLVVGVATGTDWNGRVAAWNTLLQQIAQRAGEPLRARVFVFIEGLGACAGKDRQLGDQAEQVFGLVARHPLLTRHQLAALLDTSEARVGQLTRQLTVERELGSPPDDN